MNRYFASSICFLISLAPINAFAKSVQTDAYDACVARTRHERLTCEMNCGMVLQQCYGEGIFDLENKIENLKSDIKTRNGTACASLAEDYLNEASAMENKIKKEADSMAGWFASELTLSFARQRLRNLEIVTEFCRD